MPEEFGHRLGRLVREMRGTKGFTQIELAEEVFDDVGKARLLRDLENGRTAIPQARTYIPICNFLGIGSDEIQSLLDQTGRFPSEKTGMADEFFGREIEEFPSIEAIVGSAHQFSRSTIELLATRFLISAAFDKTNDELVELLTARASEFRDFREANLLTARQDKNRDALEVELTLKGSVNSSEKQGVNVEQGLWRSRSVGI